MTTNQMPQSTIDDILKKFEPEVIRSNLIRAGLFLAGWELLKAEVEDKVRGFFLIGFDENGLTYSDGYQTRVLARHKSRFEASLLWLIESGGLTEAEAERVRKLREYRNEIAHELPKILVEPGHDVDLARIRETKDLLVRLGIFWGRIEVDINPDFDGREVADADIQSMVMLLMQHLIAAAEGTSPA